MSRLSLAIYSRAGDLLVEPVTWWPEGPGVFLAELTELGGATINVQLDETVTTGTIVDVARGSALVVFSRDGVPVWRGKVRRGRVHEIAEDEAGRYVTLFIVGEVGRLQEMVVYPSGGLGRYPFSDERTFDWTAPEFDDDAWLPVVVTPANYGQPDENYGLPEGFPDGEAEWIWNESSAGSVPAGPKYFRKATDVTSDGVYEAWSAADDTNEVFFQGLSILRSSDAAYDGSTNQVELVVSEGDLTIAAHVVNLNDLKAGFLFTLIAPLTEGAEAVVHTDDTWKVAPSGAELGMNAGQILNVLLDEYEARPGAVGPIRTWTDELDSNGDEWAVHEQVTTSVMTSTVWDVLRQMVEMEMCDFRMSPTGFELNLYNAGGAGGPVEYELGNDSLKTLDWDIEPPEAVALLVRWARGYKQVDGAGIAEHGRMESGLGLGGIGSVTAAIGQAQTLLGQFGRSRIEISGAVDPEDFASEPFTLYDLGDSLPVPGPDGLDLQRVTAIGVGVDEAGELTYDVHLADHIEEAQKRQQVLLARMANASLGGRSTSSTPPYDPRAIQPRAPEVVEFPAPGALSVMESTEATFGRAVRAREFRAVLKTASTSGSVVLELRKNGSAIATLTLDSGRASGSMPVSAIYLQRTDRMTVAITSPGTGAIGLNAEVEVA